jgi:enoyl-CoA hydratase
MIGASIASAIPGAARLLDFADFGGGGDQPYLVCRPDRALDDAQARRVAAWLAMRPCPVIALTDGPIDARLLAACDVVLDDEPALRRLLANISRAPLAAMVLVQTLRATEHMDIGQALIVESLAFATLQAGPEFKAWLAARGPAAAPGLETEPPLLLDRQGERLRLTLNRPAQRNAVDRPMRDALVEALELAETDTSIKQVELRGAGRCFSVGGDLAEFGSTPDPATAHMIRTLRSPAMALARVRERLAVRLQGVCVGAGVEFAAFGRQVIAKPNTSFQLPELSMGLIPGAGGCVSLPRRIGRQRTAWLALSGRRIGARTALDWGLIDAIDG